MPQIILDNIIPRFFHTGTISTWNKKRKPRIARGFSLFIRFFQNYLLLVVHLCFDSHGLDREIVLPKAAILYGYLVGSRFADRVIDRSLFDVEKVIWDLSKSRTSLYLPPSCHRASVLVLVPFQPLSRRQEPIQPCQQSRSGLSSCRIQRKPVIPLPCILSWPCRDRDTQREVGRRVEFCDWRGLRLVRQSNLFVDKRIRGVHLLAHDAKQPQCHQLCQPKSQDQHPRRRPTAWILSGQFQ